MSVRIGVAGCQGRMGRLLVAEIAADDETILSAGTVRAGTAADLPMVADAAALFAASDVVIDFTHASALTGHLAAARETGSALVLGTSGLDAAAEDAVKSAARLVPIVYAANFSPATNLLLRLVRPGAAALGPEYDIEITEMHHRQKVDAPSGTAIALGRAAASGRGVVLETVTEPPRVGHVGARGTGTIGFAVLRGGQVVGEHSVLFAGATEHLVLSGRSFDRRVYAQGAVRAALWVAGRAPGLYGMDDVLGFG